MTVRLIIRWSPPKWRLPSAIVPTWDVHALGPYLSQFRPTLPHGWHFRDALPHAWHFQSVLPTTWDLRAATAAALRRVHCALLGHDSEIVVGDRNMALRCRRCRWKSSGWSLDADENKPLPGGEATPVGARVPGTINNRTSPPRQTVFG